MAEDSVLPKNTWLDYQNRITPYEMLLDAIEANNEVNGIYVSWIAKQSTCEYMLWNQLIDFYEHNEIKEEKSIIRPISIRATVLTMFSISSPETPAA